MLLRNKCYPLCLLLAALAAAVAGCSSPDDADDEGTTADVPVAFAVADVDTEPDAASRAATIAGEATTANITSMGVLAYYTGAADFDDSSKPNFMNDQEISRTSAARPWTYSPVKYWPNTAGEKITFLAYSPHSSHFTEKDAEANPGYFPGGTFDMSLTSGRPYIDFAPRLQAEKQTDVLIARSVMNRTKTAGQIAFQFGHLLVKVVFKVRTTEPVHIDRINIHGMSTYGCLYYNEDGTYFWDETGIEQDKVFYSLPDKDVPAGVATAVSTFFMIPYPYYTLNCLLDVYYTHADGITKEEKTDVPFGYIAADSGEAVEYTIVIDGKAEIKVISTSVGSDWPSTPEDAGDEEVSGL